MARVVNIVFEFFSEDFVTFEKMLETAHKLDELDDIELLLDELFAAVDKYLLTVFLEGAVTAS